MSAESREKNEILGKLKESVQENKFVKITLGKYRGKEEALENIYIEPVLIQDEILYSVRYKYKTNDIFKNISFEESDKFIDQILGKDFLYASLYTVNNDFIIEYNKKREPKLFTRKPTFTKVEVKGHNKIKPRFISAKAKYLSLLGISGPKGEIKADKYFKFRQIDKFIEIVDSLYRESTLSHESKDSLNIIDLGSGKSYLTFALYDYFNYKLEKPTNVTGIDVRKDLVELSNNYAEQCACANLNFIESSILNVNLDTADIVVALHACDTATDDAIARAVKANVEIIIVAPCCQKYVRNRLVMPESLKSIFHHGIIEEHVSSFVTDGLRALVMESYGYKTKVFEFVSQEHTNKNIMITAVKGRPDENTKQIKQMEIENIKAEFGLPDFYLDTILK